MAEDGLLWSLRLHQAETVVNNGSQGELGWASSDSSLRVLKDGSSLGLACLVSSAVGAEFPQSEVQAVQPRDRGGGDSACWIPTSMGTLLSASIRKWGLSMWSWENPMFTREAESDCSIFSNVQLFLESHTVSVDSFLFPGTPRQGENRKPRLPFFED